MKKIVEQRIKVEIAYCNICEKQVKKEPFNKDRIAVVRGLFPIGDFHAHETCINVIVREAFEPYFPKKAKHG